MRDTWPLSHMPMPVQWLCGFKYDALAPFQKGSHRDQTIRQTSNMRDPTAELDDELDNLDRRIFKGEITTVMSDIYNVVLLPKD